MPRRNGAAVLNGLGACGRRAAQPSEEVVLESKNRPTAVCLDLVPTVRKRRHTDAKLIHGKFSEEIS